MALCLTDFMVPDRLVSVNLDLPFRWVRVYRLIGGCNVMADPGIRPESERQIVQRTARGSDVGLDLVNLLVGRVVRVIHE